MHPGVLECAAVGMPDTKSGEAVKLFVVQQEPALTERRGASTHCREHLTGYKCPRDVEFRGELPKSNVGKILRRELRDEARVSQRSAAGDPRRRESPVAASVTLPAGMPALRVVPMPADANFHGDIFGGWIMSQVDIAGSIPASRRARGRVATVAVNSFVFKQPVLIGDVVSFFATIEKTGRTSITVVGRGLRAAQSRRRDHRQGDRGEPHLRGGRSRPQAARAAAARCTDRVPRERRASVATRVKRGRRIRLCWARHKRGREGRSSREGPRFQHAARV